MDLRSNKGVTGIEIALIVAVVGALGWFAAPKIFHGASRRADNSAKATEQLEQATNAQGASAAASVTKIGEAAGMAASSPAIDFIRREVPVALASLPTPDPRAILRAEQRRVAVMEGKLDEARRLYEVEAKRAAKLQEERDEALAARRQADVALQEAAAAEHAATVQAMAAGGLALIALALWAWAKLNGFSTRTVGQMAADIRAGDKPTEVIDRYVPVRLWPKVKREAQLHTDLK